MFKKVVIAFDHNVNARYIQKIKQFLGESKIEFSLVFDDEEANDYPILASKAYEIMKKNKCDGLILLCGTGIGMNMVANKFNGVRSVLANSEAEAYFSRRHEDANCLVFGAGYADDAYEVKLCGRKMVRILNVFFTTEFQGEERHKRRLAEIKEIEQRV